MELFEKTILFVTVGGVIAMFVMVGYSILS